MATKRKERKQREGWAKSYAQQTMQSGLQQMGTVKPATPSYPNLGTRVMPQGEPKVTNQFTPQQKIQTPATKPTMSFNQAFAAARKQGLKQFEWRGKQYGTQLATQAPKATPKAAPTQQPTQAATPIQPVQASSPVSPVGPYAVGNNVGTQVGGTSAAGPYMYSAEVLTKSPDYNPIYESSNPDIYDIGRPHNWGQRQFTGRSNPQVEAARERLDARRSNPNQRGRIQYSREVNDAAENARRGVGDWLAKFFVPKREKGGKLEDKQEEFIAYLIELSGAKDEKDLDEYIQDLGQDGLKQEFEKFEELMTQGTEQVPAASKGAKLNYIKALRGQCPDGFEMQYFKKGGVMCSQCIKKAEAQKAPKKAANGTKVVQNFKDDMAKEKCGGKMKKKATKKEKGGTMPQDTPKTNKLAPKTKVQIKKHFFGGKL